MQKGIIICTSTNTYLVEENEKYINVWQEENLKRKINLLVGDKVEFTITNSEKQEGVIEQILHRKMN